MTIIMRQLLLTPAVGAVCLGGQLPAPRLAPDKETLSYRAYATRRRLNRLRRAACALFQSDQIVPVIEKLEREIEDRRLLVRPERKIHADVGGSRPLRTQHDPRFST